jgi:mechanosensitive ion channel-like protein
MLAIDVQRGLSEAWTDVVVFVPKLIGFLLILLVGWILGLLAEKAIRSLLQRIGVDRFNERGPLRDAFAHTQFEASSLLAAIVRWAIVLLALQLGFGIFGPNPISDAIDAIVGYLPQLFVAVVILVIAFGVARVVRDLVGGALRAVSGGHAIATAAAVAVALVGVFAALDQLGVAPAIVVGLFYAILLVIAGSAVIAIGVGGIPVVRRWLERAAVGAERIGRDVRDVAVNAGAEPTQPIDREPIVDVTADRVQTTSGSNGPTTGKEEPRWP